MTELTPQERKDRIKEWQKRHDRRFYEAFNTIQKERRKEEKRGRKKIIVRGLGIIILIIAVIYAFFVLGILASDQRAFYGEKTGNMLLTLELAIPLYGYIGYRFWKQGKKGVIKIGVWFLTASVLFFLGWFVHPDQVYGRALDRLFEIEKTIDEHAFKQKYGSYRVDADVSQRGVDYYEFYEPPDPPGIANRKWKLLQKELTTRKLEYQAASARYESKPSKFYSYSFWILGALLVSYGVFNMRSKSD